MEHEVDVNCWNINFCLYNSSDFIRKPNQLNDCFIIHSKYFQLQQIAYFDLCQVSVSFMTICLFLGSLSRERMFFFGRHVSNSSCHPAIGIFAFIAVFLSGSAAIS